MSHHQPISAKGSNTGSKSYTLQLITAAIAVLVFINASFVLRSWAMTSPLAHTLDHVIIFLSGSAFGSTLFSIWRSKR